MHIQHRSMIGFILDFFGERHTDNNKRICYMIINERLCYTWLRFFIILNSDFWEEVFLGLHIGPCRRFCQVPSRDPMMINTLSLASSTITLPCQVLYQWKSIQGLFGVREGSSCEAPPLVGNYTSSKRNGMTYSHNWTNGEH